MKVKSIEQELKIVEEMLFDVLDGQSAWWEIQRHTGLSEERCKEIHEKFKEIYKKLGY